MESSHAHGLAESILWKWLYYQKWLHVQCNPHQNSNDIHHRDWIINPKTHLKTQKTANSQGSTGQKEQHWRYHNTQLQTILQNHSNKNSMSLAQKHMRTNGTEDPNMIPCNCAHLVFDKRAQNIWWRKDSLFNKYYWENWMPLCRKLKLDPCLSPCACINSKVD
jgi:hypothetical protein